MRESIITRWEEVCTRLADNGYDSLREPEKDWINVRALIDSTENGGMISYFYNSPADHLDDCLAALDRLNANEMKGLVLRLCSLFPEGVPAKIEERNATIDSWEDE